MSTPVRLRIKVFPKLDKEGGPKYEGMGYSKAFNAATHSLEFICRNIAEDFLAGGHTQFKEGGGARLTFKHKADGSPVLAAGLSVTDVSQMTSGDEFWVEPAPLAPASELDAKFSEEADPTSPECTDTLQFLFSLSQHGALVPAEVSRLTERVASTGVPSPRTQAPSLAVIKAHVSRAAHHVHGRLAEIEPEKFASHVDTIVDTLGTIGLHLHKFGEMLSFSPFSFAFRAFGVLCETCKKVKDNEENCTRARQRAAVLVPLLSKIYQRVSLDPKVMCAAITHAVTGIAEELNAQCDLIKNFTESNFIKRGFTSGKFKESMDSSGHRINEHIKTLGLALAEGHAIKLEEVFDVVKEIRINMDAKLDEAIRLAMETHGDVLDIKKFMVEQAHRLEALISDVHYPSLILPPHFNHAKVVEMIMAGTEGRTVYVRDNISRGYAPIVDEDTHAPGPKGHHFSVEYLCPPEFSSHHGSASRPHTPTTSSKKARLLAFRVTRRTSDFCWVLDQTSPRLATGDYKGLYSVTAHKEPYNEMFADGYNSLTELLTNIAEVRDSLPVEVSSLADYSTAGAGAGGPGL